MVMTSPPYWNLRNYQVEGQLGLEFEFQEYINKLCDIFDEIKRVLKKEGNCWVNLGDTYSGHKKRNTDNKNKNANIVNIIKITKNMQSKSLIQIPYRFSIEMCNRGWILRNIIIWHKPNCMPSSVKDRFCIDYEPLFFFTKNKKYYFNTQYETFFSDILRRSKYETKSKKLETRQYSGLTCKNQKIYFNKVRSGQVKGRLKRCVWEIPTISFHEPHFAVYPEKLCITPIRAGCPENGIVLDPFSGAGTTCMVAKKLGRKYIGIDLNSEYVKISERRIERECGTLI